MVPVIAPTTVIDFHIHNGMNTDQYDMVIVPSNLNASNVVNISKQVYTINLLQLMDIRTVELPGHNSPRIEFQEEALHVHHLDSLIVNPVVRTNQSR